MPRSTRPPRTLVRDSGVRDGRLRVLTALATAAAIAAAGLVSAGPASAADADPDPAATPDETLTSAPVDPGTRLTEFPLPNPSSLPNDLVAGADGSVWVSTFADKQVLRMSRDGVITTTAQLTGGPSSLATDGEGGAWAAEYASNAIAHISAAGVVTEYPIPTANSFPAHVYDSGDLVFFTESNTGKLGRLTQSTGAIAEYSILGAGSLWDLDSIAADEIWITDPQAETIWIANSTGGIIDYRPNQDDVRDIVLSSPEAGTTQATLSTDNAVKLVRKTPMGFNEYARAVGLGSVEGLAVLKKSAWFVDPVRNMVGWEENTNDHYYQMPAPQSGLSGLTVTDGRFMWTAEKQTGRVARFDTFAALQVERIGGTDRYEVAAKGVVRFGAPKGRVFVASGEKFSDALSAGAVAAQNGGALLLTAAQTLPAVTRDALIEMAFRDVIVVGGPATISDAVMAQIKAAVPLAVVSRIGGADRYEVSLNLLRSGALPSGLNVLYLANGRDFPDALSSTPAAAFGKGAVLLVDGSSPTLNGAAMEVIRNYGAGGGTVRIAGGLNSISQGIERQVSAVAGVQRFGGADRYAVSLAIAKSVFPSGALAAFASGSVFPDALSGGALVGSFFTPAPIYLSRPTCISPEMLDQMGDSGVRRVFIFGGPNTLTTGVENLQTCR